MLSTIAHNVANSDVQEPARPYIVDLIAKCLIEGITIDPERIREFCKDLPSEIRKWHFAGLDEYPKYKARSAAVALRLILRATISSIYTQVQSKLHPLIFSAEVTISARGRLELCITEEMLHQTGLFVSAAGYELHISTIYMLLSNASRKISEMISAMARAELNNARLEDADPEAIGSRIATSLTNTNVAFFSAHARDLAAVELEHIQRSLRERIFNKTLRNPMLVRGTSAVEIGKAIVKPLSNQQEHPHLSYVVRVINHNCSRFLNPTKISKGFEECPPEIQSMIFFEVFNEQLEIYPTGDGSRYCPEKGHPWIVEGTPVDFLALCLTSESMKNKVQRHVWTEALLTVKFLEDNERCLPDPATPGGQIPLTFNGNPAPPAGMFSTIEQLDLILNLDMNLPSVLATFLKNFPLVFTGIRWVTLRVLYLESGNLYKHFVNYPANSLIPLLSSFSQSCFFDPINDSADLSVLDQDTPTSVHIWYAFEEVAQTLLAREPTEMQEIFGKVTSANVEDLTKPGQITKQNFYDAIIEYLRAEGAEETVTWLQRKAKKLVDRYNANARV